LPCASKCEGAAEMSWRDIPKNKLGELPVLREDFFGVLQECKQSADPKDLEKYSKWTAKHGMKGA
jgi:hypothetical protein